MRHAGAMVLAGVLGVSAAGGEPPRQTPEERRVEIAQALERLQPASDPEAPNMWHRAMLHTAECRGMVEMFAANSVLGKARAQRGENQPAREWLLRPFALRTEACTPEIEAEVRSMLTQMRATGVFESLDGLRTATRFIEPVSLGANDEGDVLFNGVHSTDLVLLARMREAVERRDFDEYARAFETNLAIWRAVSITPHLSAAMIAYAFQGIAFRIVTSDVMAGRLPAAECRSLLAAIERQPLPPVQSLLEMERLRGLDMIERALEPPARAGEQDVRKETIFLYNEYMDAVGRLCADNSEGERTARKAVEATLERIDAFQARTETVLLDSVLITADVGYQKSGARIVRDGLRVMLALEAVHTGRGYPDSLDALVPGALAELPRDPYGDGPFRYRLVDPATDPAGRSYILYSVGGDGEDNGGREAENNANAAAPIPAGRGFDYIINTRARW